MVLFHLIIKKAKLKTKQLIMSKVYSMNIFFLVFIMKQRIKRYFKKFGGTIDQRH